ncbi:hypothetical protein WN59_05160 [Salinicoccus sediminis]|uniref:Uncharacterized protein n=1 Tax=Salinicoccus sediminis TaxID=1432562 RepID=A0A0M2SQX4_9STAP|nr:hypothetical protein [Salinicoccus sediminis]KKK35025.1 hypothetical protein WN59_05160 [Salinicoccus sediminis]
MKSIHDNPVKSFYYVSETSYGHIEQYLIHRTCISARGLIKIEFSRRCYPYDDNESLPASVIYKYKVHPQKIKTLFRNYDFKNFKDNSSPVDDGNSFKMSVTYENGEIYKIKGNISPAGDTDELREEILKLVDFKEVPDIL